MLEQFLMKYGWAGKGFVKENLDIYFFIELLLIDA